PRRNVVGGGDRHPALGHDSGRSRPRPAADGRAGGPGGRVHGEPPAEREPRPDESPAPRRRSLKAIVLSPPPGHQHGRAGVARHRASRGLLAESTGRRASATLCYNVFRHASHIEPSREERMITLTETAAKKISDLRLEEGKPEWGLRIRVVGGGCSGMSYELGWDDAAATDDNVVESHGIKVFVDTHSAPYLSGSEIDYVDNNMLGAGFAIKNPNVKSSCGCGASHQF